MTFNNLEAKCKILKKKIAPWIQISFPKSYFEREKRNIFFPNTMMKMLAFGILPQNRRIAPFFQPNDGIGKFE